MSGASPNNAENAPKLLSIKLVPFTWIEHVASPLPRECSTTELKGLIHRPNLKPTGSHGYSKLGTALQLERVKGIEPSS
jgi:hypothetical protein